MVNQFMPVDKVNASIVVTVDVSKSDGRVGGNENEFSKYLKKMDHMGKWEPIGTHGKTIQWACPRPLHHPQPSNGGRKDSFWVKSVNNTCLRAQWLAVECCH